jgi:hypothetical protein
MVQKNANVVTLVDIFTHQTILAASGGVSNRNTILLSQ